MILHKIQKYHNLVSLSIQHTVVRVKNDKDKQRIKIYEWYHSPNQDLMKHSKTIIVFR